MKKNKPKRTFLLIFKTIGDLVWGVFLALLIAEVYSPTPLQAKPNYQIFEGYGLSSSDIKKATAEQKTPQVLAEISSLLRAYPHEIERVRYMDGDWVFMFTNGQDLYWAHGRLLPRSLKANYKKYRKYISYRYPHMPEDPDYFSPEEIQKLRRHNSRKYRARMPSYEGSFFELVYRSYSKSALENELVNFSFLGRRIPVHRKIVGPLKTVNRQILSLGKRNRRVATFLNRIRAAHGYAWRKIRGSTSMSFHSIGAAVDILPKNRSIPIYWGWEAARNSDWMLIPLDQRWFPPQEVIDIFEENGFIWGGKWALYDNMHFEYRPELLILRELEEKIDYSKLY